MKDDSLGQIENTILKGASPATTMPVNVKRILGTAFRYWYLIILSVLTALTMAFLINRYSTKVYSVNASIIVREGTENAAAEFLYQNNPLINPYRNFYNELYIMRSYPLLQEVIDSLNFGVGWFREGNVKTTENYERGFPIHFLVMPGGAKIFGKSIGFVAEDNLSYTLEHLAEDDDHTGKLFQKLPFDSIVSVNGYRFLVKRKGLLPKELIGKRYILRFRDPFELAKVYAERLKATWAEQGASVVNLELSGPLPQKEVDFLQKFIQRYQEYDRNKKNQVAVKSIEFLDQQLATLIGGIL